MNDFYFMNTKYMKKVDPPEPYVTYELVKNNETDVYETRWFIVNENGGKQEISEDEARRYLLSTPAPHTPKQSEPSQDPDGPPQTPSDT